MTTRDPIDQIIGQHPSIEALRRLARRAAVSPARCILIYGETGTGKGLLARAIHEASPRASGAFTDINCAAIPADLVESELFGHERGAFTGAVMHKIGLVEAAHKGTLFLDEVRELSQVLQAKLLTLMDTLSFRRIGSVKPIAVDVRFIAATNRILLSEVREGRFREDLYYRLQIIAINIPPLRDRGADIQLLAQSFLDDLCRRYGREPMRLSADIVEIFNKYSWPGNVRELQHLLERIVALEEGDVVTPQLLPSRVLRDVDGGQGRSLPAPEGPISFHEETERYQRNLIAAALSACEGRLSDAADRLDLSRHALRHQMLKLGMTLPDRKN